MEMVVGIDWNTHSSAACAFERAVVKTLIPTIFYHTYLPKWPKLVPMKILKVGLNNYINQ